MPLGASTTDRSKLAPSFEPVPFEDIAGWAQDDHAAALRAFIRSCKPVIEAAQNSTNTKTASASPGLLAICAAALKLENSPGSTEARAFFETHFQPHRVVHDGEPGLLTGYFEPLVDGAREQGGKFQIPLYKRPADLVNLVAESERGALAHGLTHARKTLAGTEPYATRADIEEGALEYKGLELFWLADPVDTFFMHIQGSGASGCRTAAWCGSPTTARTGIRTPRSGAISSTPGCFRPTACLSTRSRSG